MLRDLLPSSIKVLSFMKCISIFGIKPLRRGLYDFKCKLSEVTLYCRKVYQRLLPNKSEVSPSMKMNGNVKHATLLANQYLLSSRLFHFLFRRYGASIKYQNWFNSKWEQHINKFHTESYITVSTTRVREEK